MRRLSLVCLLAGPAWAQIAPVEVARLTAPTPVSGAFFGHAVALDGDTLAVSSERSGLNLPPGRVFVYSRVGGLWTFQQVLTPTGTIDFASSLALSGDRLVIGDRGFSNGIGPVGAAWVFERTAGVWHEVATLRASDEALNAGFGSALALDGDWIAVGAPRDAFTTTPPGNTYLFHWNGVSWTELARIGASDGINEDNFGWSLSMSSDRLVVGAPNRANQLGKAYVFERNGNNWSETAQLAPNGLLAPARTGSAVALSGDRAFVGSERDAASGSEIGSVTAFERQSGIWTEVARLAPSDAAQLFTPRFGGRLALDGVRVAIGAPVDYSFGGPAAGSIYLFELIGGSWTQTSKVYTRDRGIFDWFGDSIALQGDDLLAGVRGDKLSGTGASEGSARVFDLRGATGQEYCAGTTTSCPCAAGGAFGNGCPNSFATWGAGLWAHGDASVANDTLELRAGALPPSASVVFVQGTLQEGGGVGSTFGDGLLCVSGTLVRLKTLQSTWGSASCPAGSDSAISIPGGVPASGGTRTYQAYYRNPANFCTPFTFNTTNAVEIVWSP